MNNKMRYKTPLFRTPTSLSSERSTICKLHRLHKISPLPDSLAILFHAAYFYSFVTFPDVSQLFVSWVSMQWQVHAGRPGNSAFPSLGRSCRPRHFTTVSRHRRWKTCRAQSQLDWNVKSLGQSTQPWKQMRKMFLCFPTTRRIPWRVNFHGTRSHRRGRPPCLSACYLLWK